MLKSTSRGFTIVELLIVIVVIAILAAISIVAYNGIQERARKSKVSSDLATISKAIQSARINNDSSLIGVVPNGSTEGGCLSQPSGTNLATLPASNSCWAYYNTAMQQISSKSGIDVSSIKDPWGRPYYINPNEDENQTTHVCLSDYITTYKYPHVQNQTEPLQAIPYWKSSC